MDNKLTNEYAVKGTEIEQLPTAQLGTNLAEVGTDCISRQAAIDAMAELQGRASSKGELKGISKAWKWIKQLPPIQPEIVRCKDCKHYDEIVHCDRVSWWNGKDDYCSRAERREVTT